MHQQQTPMDGIGAARRAARYAAVHIGLGARIIGSALRRCLEHTGIQDEVDAQLQRLGAMVYATHTGSPTDSEALLEQMKKVDEAMERLRRAEGADAAVPLRCPNCSEDVEEGDAYCGVCGQKL